MSTSAFKLDPDVVKLEDQLVEDRRWFHAHPELSMQEHKTADFVVARLRAIGVEEICEHIAGTGVTGLITGAHPGKCIALRADMDGLPIREATGLEFSSENEGVMHACGHDGHMAILLCVAQVLVSRKAAMKGSVKLLFQPAEENIGGAEPMIAAGVLDSPHVDEVYGLHLWNYESVGAVTVLPGSLMAASDRFKLTVRGKGGHGAAPDSTIDAVVMAAHAITTLQTVVSRSVPPLQPAVLTCGTISGGFAPNVIADKVEVEGTVRTMTPEIQALVKRRMEEATAGVAAAFGGEIDVEYNFGYPATINTSDSCLHCVKAAATNVVGPQNIVTDRPTMAAEDFSCFLNARPGCFFFIGSGSVGQPVLPHHKSCFTIDESALPIGASVMLGVLAELFTGGLAGRNYVK